MVRNIRRDYEVLSRFTSGRWAVQPETGQIYIPEQRRMMKTLVDHDGYLCISTRSLGSNYPMARAVWIGATLSVPAFDDLEVDHINGNRQDNRFANLRLLTHAGNVQKRVPPLSSECAEEIRREYSETKTSCRKLAVKYRRNESTIRRIIRNQHYTNRTAAALVSADCAADSPCRKINSQRPRSVPAASPAASPADANPAALPPSLTDERKAEIFHDFCVEGRKVDVVLRKYGIGRDELRAVIEEESVKAAREKRE